MSFLWHLLLNTPWRHVLLDWSICVLTEVHDWGVCMWRSLQGEAQLYSKWFSCLVNDVETFMGRTWERRILETRSCFSLYWFFSSWRWQQLCWNWEGKYSPYGQLKELPQKEKRTSRVRQQHVSFRVWSGAFVVSSYRWPEWLGPSSVTSSAWDGCPASLV